MKPKVSLIRAPSIHRNIRIIPPYSLGCLASHLRENGYEVILEDFALKESEYGIIPFIRKKGSTVRRFAQGLKSRIVGKAARELAEKLRQKGCRIAGFSVFSGYELPLSVQIAKELKEIDDFVVVFLD